MSGTIVPYMHEWGPIQGKPCGLAAWNDDIWFTEFTPGRIGRIMPDGTLIESRIDLLTPGCQPTKMVRSRNFLWFIESNPKSPKIGRFNPDNYAGSITTPFDIEIDEFPVRTLRGIDELPIRPESVLTDITSFWYDKDREGIAFTEHNADKIGLLDVATGEVVGEFFLGPDSGPSGITWGPSPSMSPRENGRMHYLWITEDKANKIAVFDPRLGVVEDELPYSAHGGISPDAGLRDIVFVPPFAMGPPSLWGGASSRWSTWVGAFTERKQNKIGLIIDRVVTELPIPTKGSDPRGITCHWNDPWSIWFTEYTEDAEGVSRIGEVRDILDPDRRHIREYPIPTRGCMPRYIISTGKNVVFTEFSKGKIAAHWME